jgi:hypothetical protein
MSDAEVVPFPKDQRDERWWEATPIMVRWQVSREHSLPVVVANGTIMVEREPVGGDDGYDEVGRIHIVKPFLDSDDIVTAMDSLTSDHEFLASQILDGAAYEEEFTDWFEAEFGIMLGSDPVFVLDLTIDEKHRDPDCLVAAHAALDALSTFGGSSSALVTFHFEGVNPELRRGLRDEGLWAWVHALRAKRWKSVYVAARPQMGWGEAEED